MNTPTVILVATDFSPPSDNALSYAVELGQKLGATVHVAHAYELPVVGFPDGVLTISAETASRLVDAAEKALSDQVAPYAARGIHLTTSLEQADPREGILEAARKVGADLIVVGTHGRRGIARALIGSVAENVVRTAPVPVLTVRSPAAAPA